MFFLLRSEKWAPYRDYWYEEHGTKATTFLIGLLTVLMMPILFWLTRRGENAIQFLFGVRKLANYQSGHFLESIVVILQKRQIPILGNELKHKLKVLLGLVLSKIYLFILFGWIYGLDQISSNVFKCRNLKDGAEFLLGNETKPAQYMNMTFAEITEMKKKNGKDVDWWEDHVNGLLPDYFTYEYLGAEIGDIGPTDATAVDPVSIEDIWWFYIIGSDDRKRLQTDSRTPGLIESFNVLGFHEVCNVLTE